MPEMVLESVKGVGAVHGERGIIDDGAAERAREAGVSKLERTGGNGGQAGVGVVGGEDGGAGAELLKLAGTGDGVGKGEGVGAIYGEEGVVDDRA